MSSDLREDIAEEVERQEVLGCALWGRGISGRDFAHFLGRMTHESALGGSRFVFLITDNHAMNGGGGAGS